MCLLLPLTSCGKAILRTETVDVEKPVIVPVPPTLTHVDPEPALPPGELTNDDLADMIDRLRAWGRGLAGKLRQIQSLPAVE